MGCPCSGSCRRLFICRPWLGRLEDIMIIGGKIFQRIYSRGYCIPNTPSAIFPPSTYHCGWTPLTSTQSLSLPLIHIKFIIYKYLSQTLSPGLHLVVTVHRTIKVLEEYPCQSSPYQWREPLNPEVAEGAIVHNQINQQSHYLYCRVEPHTSAESSAHEQTGRDEGVDVQRFFSERCGFRCDDQNREDEGEGPNQLREEVRDYLLGSGVILRFHRPSRHIVCCMTNLLPNNAPKNAPRYCDTIYGQTLPTPPFSFTPIVTAGLKCPPVNSPAQHIAKNSEADTKISVGYPGRLASATPYAKNNVPVNSKKMVFARGLCRNGGFSIQQIMLSYPSHQLSQPELNSPPPHQKSITSIDGNNDGISYYFIPQQRMLTTSAQQKIFARLLTNPSNARCADCNAKSPTWASIDFGVFVCLNCSGAHRALGPSVTRVRSTKLDTWQSEWVELMELGNELCNTYWLANLGSSPKITANSGLDEIKRYVADKYIKRKYAKKGDSDPVTNLKNFKAKNKANSDFNSFDFKTLKDQDRFKTVSGGGGGFSFESFNARKNSGSVEKTKKKESFDIFSFDETPKHQNNFINPVVGGAGLYEKGGDGGQKGHGHSLDFYTVSHHNFPVTFNQGQQQQQHQHQPQVATQMPTFNELANLFPNPSPQPQGHHHNHQSSFDFNNVFNQPQATKPHQPHNMSYTKTSANHSFDIFGTSNPNPTTPFHSPPQPQSQSHSSHPISMNINMYANNINFNFTPHTDPPKPQKKDPFGQIDQFNF